MIRTRHTAVIAAIALTGGAILLSGCGSSSSSSSSGSRAQASGSSFAARAYTQWCQDSGLCSYVSKGSGAGITDFTNGVVDWAGSDSALKAPQLAALASARGGVTPVYFPTFLGGVTVPTHVTGTASLQFSGDVLADIFDGAITTWNDPKIAADNPGVTLPSAPITVCVRSDASGTSSNFTSYLAQANPAFVTKVGQPSQQPAWTAPRIVQGIKNSGVLQCVSDNADSIGYVDLADVVSAGQQAIVAKIKASDGTYVAPTATSIAAAGANVKVTQPVDAKALQTALINSSAPGAYPISITTFLLAYSDYTAAGKTASLPKVKSFLTYAYGATAQGELAKLGYAPLPAAIRTAAVAQEGTLK